MVHTNIQKLILSKYHALLKTDFVISVFSECEFPTYEIQSNDQNEYTLVFKNKVDLIYHLSSDKELYEGKIFQDTKGNLYYIDHKSTSNIIIKKLMNKSEISLPLIPSVKEPLKITKNDNIPNITSDIITTYGKFMLNVYLTITPFEDNNVYPIPYINESFSAKKILNIYKDLIFEKKVFPEQVTKFFTNLDFLQTFTDIFVPSMTEKLLTPSPEAKRKLKELLEKYKDKLNDTETMIKIEDEIIKLDKEYLKDDESAILLSNKTFNVHRKLMFYLYGAVEAFGDEDSNQKYNFISSNLDEGMNVKDMPKLFNEARRGFVKRAVETALGGTLTKDIARFLQDLELKDTDCKTKRHLKYHVTSSNYEDILYRYIIDGDKTILLTKDNIKKYIGKTVKLRSPMKCELKDGICYKCSDHIWEMKRSKVINVIPVSISSTIMYVSMKAMHGTKVSYYELNDIDSFIYDL